MPAHITLVGRLARDPESRASAKGTNIVKLTIPIDTGWGDNKTTTWWTAALFGKRAEAAAQYLRKGSWVAVSGAASVRSYTKRDGSTGNSAEVAVDDWSFVGPKQTLDDQPRHPRDEDVNRRPRYDQGRALQGVAESDIPF